MSLSTLKAQCLAEIERAYEIVENYYNVTLPRVPVKFSNRMTRSGGNAGCRINRMSGELTPLSITLSIPLLKLNGEVFVTNTPAHEAMHIATFAMWNIADHGRQWKGLMRLVNRSTSRTHSMEVAPTRSNSVLVHCNCSEHQMGRARYNRMSSGKSTYSCKLCGSGLKTGPMPGKVTEERTIESTRPAPAPTATDSINNGMADAIAKLKAKGIQLSMAKGNKDVHEFLAKKFDITVERVRVFIIHNWAIIK